MFYPLLRTIPALTGNFMLACDISTWRRESTISHIANIDTASLMPLQNSVYNRLINVNLLNDNYEFDVARYYKHYSDIFYDENYVYNPEYIPDLDVTSNDVNNENTDRNKNYEMGCKRVPVSSTGYQFCFFAPIYIDNVKDIPDAFIIDVNFGDGKNPIHKKLTFPISLEDGSSLYTYLKKYVEQITSQCIFCKTDTCQAAVYGINVKQGGFTIATDNIIGNIFKTYMRVNDVDKIITESFKRTKTIIRQIIPIAFMFNIEPILTLNEKKSLLNTKIHITGHYEKNGMRCDFADLYTNYDTIDVNGVNILSRDNDVETSYAVNSFYDKKQVVAYYTTNYNEQTYSYDVSYTYTFIMEDCLFAPYINKVTLNEKNDINVNKLNTVSKTFNRWVLYTDDIDNNYVTNSSQIYNSFNGFNDRGIMPAFDNSSTYLWICDDGTIDMNKSRRNDNVNYNENWFYETKWYAYDIPYSDGWENVNNNKIYYRGLLYDFNPIIKDITLYNINTNDNNSYINIYDNETNYTYSVNTYTPDTISKFGVFIHPIVLSTENAYLTKRALSYLNYYTFDDEIFVDYNNRYDVYKKYYVTNSLFIKRTKDNLSKYPDKENEIWARYDNRSNDGLSISPTNNYINRNKYYRAYIGGKFDGDITKLAYGTDNFNKGRFLINSSYEFISHNIGMQFTVSDKFDEYADRLYINYDGSNRKISLKELSNNSSIDSLYNFSLYVKNDFIYYENLNDEVLSYVKSVILDNKGYICYDDVPYQYEVNLNDMNNCMSKIDNILTTQLFVDSWNINNYIENIITNDYSLLSDEYKDYVLSLMRGTSGTNTAKIKRFLLNISNQLKNKQQAYIKYVDNDELNIYRNRLYNKNNVYTKQTYMYYSEHDGILDVKYYDKFDKANNISENTEYFHYSYVIPLNSRIYELMTMNEHADFMIYGRDLDYQNLVFTYTPGNNIVKVMNTDNINNMYGEHVAYNTYVLYPLNTHYLLEQTSHDKIENLINSYNIHKINNDVYGWNNYECECMRRVEPFEKTENYPGVPDYGYVVTDYNLYESHRNIYSNNIELVRKNKMFSYSYTNYNVYDTIKYSYKNECYDTIEPESNKIDKIYQLAYSYNYTYSYVVELDSRSEPTQEPTHYIITYITDCYHSTYLGYTYHPSFIRMNPIEIIPQYTSDNKYNLVDVYEDDYVKYLNVGMVGNENRVQYSNEYYSYAYQPHIIKYSINPITYILDPYTYSYEDENENIIQETCYTTHNITYTVYNIELNSNIYSYIKDNSDLIINDDVCICSYDGITTNSVLYDDVRIDPYRRKYYYNTYITQDTQYSSYSYFSTEYNMPQTYVNINKFVSYTDMEYIAQQFGIDVSLFKYLLIDMGTQTVSYVTTKTNVDEGLFAYYYMDVLLYPNDISFNVRNNTEINPNSLSSYSLSELIPFLKTDIFGDCFKNISEHTLVQPINVILDKNVIYSDTLETIAKTNNNKILVTRYYHDIRPMLFTTNNMDRVSMLKYKMFKNIYKTTDVIYNHNNISIYDYPGMPIIGTDRSRILMYYPYEYKFYNDNWLYLLEPKIVISKDDILTYDKLLEVETMDYVFNNIFKPYMKQYLDSDDNNEYLFLFKKYNINFVSNPIKLNTNKTNKLYTIKYEFNLI